MNPRTDSGPDAPSTRSDGGPGHGGAGGAGPLLRVEGLCKAFGGVRAVDDVHLEVCAGELLALIGPNGAGKSTCFNAINGQLRPDAGSVRFDGREIGRRVRAALDRVGLLERERLAPQALSGGEQQRLCIARAVVHRPALILADEPTANLDEAYAREIGALFQALHAVGTTLVVSTHSPAAFASASVRLVALEAGRLAG